MEHINNRNSNRNMNMSSSNSRRPNVTCTTYQRQQNNWQRSQEQQRRLPTVSEVVATCAASARCSSPPDVVPRAADFHLPLAGAANETGAGAGARAGAGAGAATTDIPLDDGGIIVENYFNEYERQEIIYQPVATGIRRYQIAQQNSTANTISTLSSTIDCIWTPYDAVAVATTTALKCNCNYDKGNLNTNEEHTANLNGNKLAQSLPKEQQRNSTKPECLLTVSSDDNSNSNSCSCSSNNSNSNSSNNKLNSDDSQRTVSNLTTTSTSSIMQDQQLPTAHCSSNIAQN